jgi:ADP-ribose pyrophosphatase YjhB (NUDIX family)
MTYDPQPDAGQEWREHRVGQGILLRDDSVLLCANRWYSNRPPVWTLPGGRAETGEAVIEALVREIAEETGLQIAVSRLAYVAEARSVTTRRLFLTCAFAVTLVEGELHSQDPSIAELRFVPISDLGVYLPAPSLGEPLINYLSDPVAPARYWFYPEYLPAAES